MTGNSGLEPNNFKSLTEPKYEVEHLSAIKFQGMNIQPNSCFALFMTISKSNHVFTDIPENLKVFT